MNSKYIGTVVQHHRKTAGLSRVALARISGVGKTTIYDIEHGKETVQLRSLLLVLNALSIEIRFDSRVMNTLDEVIRKGKFE